MDDLQPFCEIYFLKAIESDFHSSKTAAGSHFLVHSAASSSLAAPPEGEDLVTRASVPDTAAAPEIPSALSDDPGTYLEDELCHFSPLQEAISPLPPSGDDVLMSPSRYPARPEPTMDISVSETQVSPSQSRVVNASYD